MVRANLHSKFLKFRPLLNNVVIESLEVLSKRDRKNLLFITIFQALLGFLDVIGVAVISVIGALTVSGISSGNNGNRIETVLRFLQIENYSIQKQIAILSFIGASFLISKTIASIIFTRRVTFFLSRKGAELSSKLVSQILSESILFVQSKSTQELVYSVTHGVTSIVLGVLSSATSLISDSSLLVMIAIILFVIDPITAVFTTVLLLTIVFFLYSFLQHRAKRLGQLNSTLEVASADKVSEILYSYREAVVRNRRNFYALEFSQIRSRLADVLAEMAFMPNISKYVIEVSVILGAVLISGAQFLFFDAKHAIANLAVFLAAGTRVAPAILRAQQSALQIRTSQGIAKPTLDLINLLAKSETTKSNSDFVPAMTKNHKDFVPEVLLENVSYRYPGNTQNAIDGISFAIEPGSTVAIVGPSGSGKTTLVDLLLGVLHQQSGQIVISGHSPLETISIWPGAISYVPQDIQLINGTIRENIASGFPSQFSVDEFVVPALEQSGMAKEIARLANGLDTPIGERGAKLSGGQRQRIGIARGLFTSPRLLVLDEATSALDADSENFISETIFKLKGSSTVVLIAHRLSSVRNADKVIYLENGKLCAVGTFDQVRKAVPNFDRQAKLMGL